MEEAGKEEIAKAKPQKTVKRWLAAAAGLTIVAFAVGALGAQFLARPDLSVPDQIAKKVPFPIYLPRQLPGNFEVIKTSFSFQEEVLIFKATDGTGAAITFSEQKRQPDFDFTRFYNLQLKAAKTLNDVPHPSVFGYAKNGQTRVLSVVTDETWVFVSTVAPLEAEDMQIVAAGLKLDR